MAAPWPPRPLPAPPRDLCGGVVIRLLEPEDAPALVGAWADGEIGRWLDPPPADLATAAAWIAGEPERRLRATALDLAIELEGVAVGEIGFSHFDEARRACLVGYWLARSARGRGVAAAALESATHWLRGELGALTVVAECHPDNTASHRVAERAGYELIAPDHAGRRVYAHRG